MRRRSRAAMPRSGGLDGARVSVLGPRGSMFIQGEEDSMVRPDPGAEGGGLGGVAGPRGAITWEGIGVQGGM